MDKDFLKPYDHSQEKDIYNAWLNSGFFNPDNAPQVGADSNADKRGKKIGTNRRDNLCKSAFSIIMPPPNANGSLHVGHAVMIAIEDIMIRYNRMRGKKTLWLPGADHAGFETQVVFEKKLEKEGTSRFEILKQEGGRETLYRKIFEFTQSNKKHMEDQVKQIGASCDWSRERFTLDPKIIGIVYRTFKKLYDEGLVYRDKRIVNWCIKHQTSLSDLEVSWEQREDKLYYVKYKLVSQKGEIIIATTRPETIPGDVAIAVNPKDKRYKNLVGEKAIEPITQKEIPIVGDDAVDISFGTGALKITPAHDAVDFEVGKRHSLKTLATLDLNGRFNKLAGPLEGMKIGEAREKAVELLQKSEALKKTENYSHQVGVCYKCKSVVEPMILDQWFIDLTGKGKKAIIQPAINAVKKGKIKIVPKFQEKIFFHWMGNIRDWNISRQIVWGIPIPVWYCTACGKETVHIEEGSPKNCSACGHTELKKDTDVFDTWFSSGQWPFATLLAQGSSKSKIKNQNAKLEDEEDFKNFYPTSVMETGYDILFFWVARMIMLGLYVTGKIPFETVYLHGLVRDKDKQKMSKSKGNVVDPLGVVEQFGADALRMALVVGNSPGQDVIYDENKIKGYRNFSNKLWNIARFVLTNTDTDGLKTDLHGLNAEDKKIFEQCEKIKRQVSEEIEKFRFSQAAEIAYHYIWHDFADKIIEDKKKIISEGSKESDSARTLLYLTLIESIKMLHPFMPFVTEAIYQRLPKKDKDFLMVEEW
jgi:valyl-tRNA synthetase